jgi:hypothetical protein
MRKALALTCLIAATLGACGKKTGNAPAASAPPAPAANAVAAVNAPAVPAQPSLPAVSPEACAVLATYVKVELKGDFGLPVLVRVQPAKGLVTAAELTKTFPGLKPAEAKALAEGLTRSIKDGSQLDCDWKALALEPPRPVTPESNASFRLRPVAAGDVGLLETFTDAGTTTLGGRCLYRKTGATWTRDKCVLTALN